MIPGLIGAGLSVLAPKMGPIGDFVSKASGDIDSFVNKPDEKHSMTGAEAGGQNRDFMQASFPGTNPWEWLGASSSYGSSAGPEIQARTQERLQNNELQVRERIADKQNRTNLLTSLSPQGANVVNSAMQTYNSGKSMPQHDTALKQMRERLEHELPNLDSATKSYLASAALDEAQKGLVEAEIPMAVERAKKRGWLVNAEIAERYARLLGSVVAGGVTAYVGMNSVRQGRVRYSDSSGPRKSGYSSSKRSRSNFDTEYGVYDSIN